MPSFSTDLGLSALPEISQNQYPDIYRELLEIRQAFQNMQAYFQTLAGGNPGQVLTKNGTDDFEYTWV